MRPRHSLILAFRFAPIHRLYLDKGGMNFPVWDAFEPRELFFRRLDCPFGGGRRSNDDRTLATVEKPIVSRNLIDDITGAVD
jgi:hypothetical protein